MLYDTITIISAPHNQRSPPNLALLLPRSLLVLVVVVVVVLVVLSVLVFVLVSVLVLV